MIEFRPMREGDYAAYLAYFLPEYATEIAANYRLSEPDAIAQAEREMAADLPDGVNTSGQVLLCLVDPSATPERLVGYLWYTPEATTRSAFISDFHILAGFQGNGLAKQALAVLEADLHGKGFEQIRLRVAESNGRARHVYEATGFRVTGVNMSKPIGAR